MGPDLSRRESGDARVAQIEVLLVEVPVSQNRDRGIGDLGRPIAASLHRKAQAEVTAKRAPEVRSTLCLHHGAHALARGDESQNIDHVAGLDVGAVGGVTQKQEGADVREIQDRVLSGRPYRNHQTPVRDHDVAERIDAK